MNNPYATHFWSSLYHEERLAEAQARRLTEQARRTRAPRSLRDRASLAWNIVRSAARRLVPSG
jgi:hypothetical protein